MVHTVMVDHKYYVRCCNCKSVFKVELEYLYNNDIITCIHCNEINTYDVHDLWPNAMDILSDYDA